MCTIYKTVGRKQSMRQAESKKRFEMSEARKKNAKQRMKYLREHVLPSFSFLSICLTTNGVRPNILQ